MSVFKPLLAAAPDPAEPAGPHPYMSTDEWVGNELRNLRRARRLSMRDVDALTGSEFKASVLGAYERGERAISVARLVRLAELYGVPAGDLLPPPEEQDDEEEQP